jgi:hypothetical protein
MSVVTLKSLTQKLRYAPNSVLEKLWGYADALLESDEVNFKLTEQQKNLLLSQNQVPEDQCTDAEEVFQQLKKKHDL